MRYLIPVCFAAMAAFPNIGVPKTVMPEPECESARTELQALRTKVGEAQASASKLARQYQAAQSSADWKDIADALATTAWATGKVLTTAFVIAESPGLVAVAAVGGIHFDNVSLQDAVETAIGVDSIEALMVRMQDRKSGIESARVISVKARAAVTQLQDEYAALTRTIQDACPY